MFLEHLPRTRHSHRPRKWSCAHGRCTSSSGGTQPPVGEWDGGRPAISKQMSQQEKCPAVQKLHLMVENSPRRHGDSLHRVTFTPRLYLPDRNTCGNASGRSTPGRGKSWSRCSRVGTRGAGSRRRERAVWLLSWGQRDRSEGGRKESRGHILRSDGRGGTERAET